MTFSRHVDHLVRQMKGTLCYISRYRYFLTEHTTCLLVDSLVLSKLSYCSVVCGDISQSDVNRLQKVVNFAARVIFNKKKQKPVSPLLRQLNWLNVGNRLLLDLACFMYKVEHNRVPDTIAALFTRVRDISRRYTRQTRNFYVLMIYNKAGQRALWYRGAKAWPDISLALRNCTKCKEFRESLQ